MSPNSEPQGRQAQIPRDGTPIPKTDRFLPVLVEEGSVQSETPQTTQHRDRSKKLNMLQLSQFYSVLVDRGVQSAPTRTLLVAPSRNVTVTECLSAPLSPAPHIDNATSGRGCVTSRSAAVPQVTCTTITSHVNARDNTGNERRRTVKIKALYHRPVRKGFGKKGENDVIGGSRYHRVKRDKNIPEDLQYRPKVSLPSNKEPTFFIGGCNGVQLICDALEALGWRRSKDKLDENFKLKWTELKSHINYASFREGEQLVNHIPNCQLLTNKVGLLSSLQEYERLTTQMNPKAKRPKLRLNDFFPETYRLDDPKEREQFYQQFKEKDVWICKPTGKNQGRGIYLVRHLDDIKRAVEEHEGDKQTPKSSKPQNRIIQRRKWQNYYENIVDRVIQRYIMNPLLLMKRKFDIRTYMLLASSQPFVVLYHKGYVRLSMHEYDNDSDNLVAHLTNQFIQKKDPLYKVNKEETAWSMDRFNDYINIHVAPEKNLETDWVYNTLTNKMKQISLYAFHSAKARLQTKIGYFELYGLDFMVDDNMKVYLIEINVNPCLAINCEALKEVVPGVVRESLYLSIECFEKNRKGRPIMPLQSLRNFTVLYNGSPKLKPTPPTSASPTRSLSTGPSRQSSPAETRAPSSAAGVSLGGTSSAEAGGRAGVTSTTHVRRSKSLSPAKEHTSAPASGTNTGTGSASGSAGLICIQSLDSFDPSGADALVRRGGRGARHRSSVPFQPAQRGVAPKATSTIAGSGFRKSTFPALVDAPTSASASGGMFGPKVASPVSADPVRLKMTHAAQDQTKRPRSRTRGALISVNGVGGFTRSNMDSGATATSGTKSAAGAGAEESPAELTVVSSTKMSRGS